MCDVPFPVRRPAGERWKWGSWQGNNEASCCRRGPARPLCGAGREGGHTHTHTHTHHTPRASHSKMVRGSWLVLLLLVTALGPGGGDAPNESLGNETGAGGAETGTGTHPAEESKAPPTPEPATAEPHEPEPTSPASEYEAAYSYVLSRLTAMDQAIHRLNVGHYTLDVKLTQLLDRLSRLDAKLLDMDDEIQRVFALSRDNQKEVGRLEGCQKGRRVGHKCFLVFRTYETYGGASQRCLEKGGRMAMPRDRMEQEALADYARGFFHPGNWPIWLGINDLRSEGLYLFDDGTRVTYFQWRKHFLSSQPDGGKRENCVAISSDDGDWWDNYCDRRMYYLCEFDV